MPDPQEFAGESDGGEEAVGVFLVAGGGTAPS